MKNENTSAKRLLTVFIINQSMHWFTIGMIIPVITLFRLDKGVDLFGVGIIGAVGSAAVILLEIPTGGLADAIGRKKTYLISLGLLAAADVVLYFARGIIMLAAGTLLFGAARAISSGSLDAWFVDEFYSIEKKEKLQGAFAKINAVVPAGLALSALAAGLLPGSLGKVIESRTGNTVYAANIAAQLICVLVQTLLTVLLIKEHRNPRGGTESKTGLRRIPHIIREAVKLGFGNRDVLFLFITVLGWGIGFSGLEGFWQPRFKVIAAGRFTPFLLGLMTAGYFISGSAGSLLSTYAARLFRGNLPLLLFSGRFLMGGLYILLSFIINIPGFAVIYFTLFAVNGLESPPSDTLFNERIDSSTRSTMLSLRSFFLQTGGMAGGLLVGYIAREISVPRAWLVSASALMLTGVCYLFVKRDSDRRTADVPAD